MAEGRRLPPIAPASSTTTRVVSSSHARRHIAVAACQECRAKKRKCSGTSPCTACVAQGKECVLDLEQPQQRRIAAKQRLAQMESRNSILKKRVDSLEKEMKDIRGRFPSSQGGTIQSATQEISADLLALTKEGLPSHSKEDWGSLWAIYEKVRGCAPEDLAAVVNAIRNSPNPIVAAQYLRQTPLDQLAHAQIDLGKLQRELNFMNPVKLPALCEEPMYTVPAKPWTRVTDSDKLVSHLLSLYFTWDYPVYNWLDQHLFLTDMINGQARFCSKLLVNAILAHACLYSHSLKKPWDRLTELNLCIQFLSEARQIWLSQPQPSLTTIQALIIMNITYNCLGKDKVGWMCLTTAISMAQDLGLYEPPNDEEHDGNENYNRVRAATAWGLFDWHTLVASVMQREPLLPHPPYLDFPYLDHEPLDTSRFWNPYPFKAPLYQSSVCATFKARTELSIILNKITKFTLNFDDAAPQLDAFMSLYKSLWTWSDGLGPQLLPSRDSAPHIIMLHLHYHLGMISLCKPLNASGAVVDINSHQISENAKIASRELIFLYKQTFGWKSASNFLNHALCFAAFNAIPYAREGDLRWRRSLETCISGLWHISFSFPVCRYLLRAVQHSLRAAGVSHADLSSEVAQILRYFDRSVWKASLLGSLESQYSIAYDTESNKRTVEGLLQSVEDLSLDG